MKRYLSYFAQVRDLLRAVAFCLVSLCDVTTGNSAGEYFSSRLPRVTGEAGKVREQADGVGQQHSSRWYGGNRIRR